MSQTRRGAVRPLGTDDRQTRLTDTEDVQRVLDALDDPDCRAILEATRNGWSTVDEIGEACDLPQSTAYRKVDLLADADLLEESLRIRSSGSHVSTYACAVEDLTVSVEGDGVAVSLQRQRRDDAESLAAPADD